VVRFEHSLDPRPAGWSGFLQQLWDGIGSNGQTLIETLYKNGFLDRMGGLGITDRHVSSRRISFVIDWEEKRGDEKIGNARPVP